MAANEEGNQEGLWYPENQVKSFRERMVNLLNVDEMLSKKTENLHLAVWRSSILTSGFHGVEGERPGFVGLSEAGKRGK